MNEHRGLWRGKRVDNGEWVYGTPLQHCDGDWQLISGKVGAMVIQTVIADTLGECTGLRDKNGKLIFEGDICIATNNFVDGEYGVVKYCEQEAIYTVIFNSTRLDFSRQLQGETEIEVIGNIHDNPDLLRRATGEDIGNAARIRLCPKRKGGDTMEAMFNITINLSPDDVKQIIAEYLAKEGYSVKPDDIKFKISEECHGYGTGEHYTTVFSGCSVKCDAGGK